MATHSTASCFINDNESGLLHDYEIWLEKLAPHEPSAKWWLPLQKGNSTSGRGNRFSTGSRA